MGSEIVIILLLLVVNGIFSGTELAMVSARRGRLQQKADDGDEGEDGFGRDHCLDVGIAGPREERGGGDDQLVAVEPVGSCLEQHEDADQHRELGSSSGSGALPRRRGTDPAVEVVDGGGGKPTQDDDDHRAVDEEPPPRQ